MADQPKDIKPRIDGDGQKDNSVKLILINLISTLVICVLFISINYILQDNLLTAKFANLQTQNAEDSAEGETEEVQRGLIIDLGDFILNLADTDAKRYLKANVALEVTRAESDPSTEPAAAAGGGGHGGHGGHGAPAPVDPMKQIEQQMAQYKPAIRDAVITALSSKTAEELATAPGKELAKEQIMNDVNAIFAGEREVLRVSFGQFIIQ